MHDLETVTNLLDRTLPKVPSDHPRVVVIPPGVYRHDKLVNIRSLTNVTIVARGVEFVIPEGPLINCSPGWLRFKDPFNVTVIGLTITDLGSLFEGCKEQSHGITVGGGSGFHLRDLTISGVGDEGVQIGITKYATIRNSTFINCCRETPQAAGAITLHGSTMVDISGCIIRDQVNRVSNAIRIEASGKHKTTVKGVTARNNMISDVPAGFVCSVSNNVDGVVCVHNTFLNVARPTYFRVFGETDGVSHAITNKLVGDNQVLDL